MNYIKDVQLKNEDKFNMIVEILKGSKDKNELQAPDFKELACVKTMKLKYPFYYGCFPQTLAGDKDPADCILLTKAKHELLDIVTVKPIAVVKTIDNGQEDNKIICVEGELKGVNKIVKAVFKFLKSFKGKDSNTIVDTVIGGKEDAVKVLNAAALKYSNKFITNLKVQ